MDDLRPGRQGTGETDAREEARSDVPTRPPDGRVQRKRRTRAPKRQLVPTRGITLEFPALLRKIALPIGIVAAAAAVAVALVATKPSVERTPVPERTWTIAAQAVQIQDVQPKLRLLGEIVAGRSVELRPLVAGRVVEVGDGYVEGGIVPAGSLLIAIDRFEYEATLKESESRLIEARARLDELQADLAGNRAMLERDLEQLTLSEREARRRAELRKRGTGTQKALDDSQMSLAETKQRVIGRNQGIAGLEARIEQQRAVIAQRQVAVDRANRDLTHTRLTAPFDAFLTDTGTAVGKQVGTGDKVARLIDANWLEARLHVSDAEFARLIGAGGIVGRKADVIWRAGARDFTFKASIERSSSQVDSTSGGVDLYGRIIGTGPDTVLRPGVFVEVEIPDQTYEKVVRLPESAVQGNDTVYVVIDGRLEPRRVTLVARADKDVLVRGELQNGDQVATTSFAEIGPGVKVLVR